MPAKRKPSKPSPKRAEKAETPKRGKGRPEFKPTAEQRNMVQVMSGYGIPQDKIAVLIINPETGAGISEVTLRKVFHTEIQTGLAQAQVKVVGALFKNATEKENVIAQIFLAKSRYGYRDRDSVKVDMTVKEKDGDENSKIEQARRVAFVLALGARAAKAAKALAKA